MELHYGLLIIYSFANRSFNLLVCFLNQMQYDTGSSLRRYFRTASFFSPSSMMCIVLFVIVRLSPVLIIHPQVISMRYKANFPRACIISCYLTGFVLMNLSLSEERKI